MLTKDDLKEIGKLLSPINKILVEHTKRFDKQDVRFDKVEGRLEKVEERFDKVEERFDNVEGQLNEIDKKLAINRASVVRIENNVGKALELRLDVSQVREQVRDHEERISELERFPKPI